LLDDEQEQISRDEVAKRKDREEGVIIASETPNATPRPEGEEPDDNLKESIESDEDADEDDEDDEDEGDTLSSSDSEDELKKSVRYGTLFTFQIVTY